MTDINGVEIKVGMKAVVHAHYSENFGRVGVTRQFTSDDACEYVQVSDEPAEKATWSSWLKSNEITVIP